MNFLPDKEPEDKSDTKRAEEALPKTEEFKDRITVLTIAYHNLAVE